MSLRRDQAYLGVLVDDLITKGVSEPYRMFTSRAEFRLQLREDNADARLTELGHALGLVDEQRWAAFNRKRDAVARTAEQLKRTWVNPGILPAEDAERVLGKAIEREYSLIDLLRRPGLGFDAVIALAQAAGRGGLGGGLGGGLDGGSDVCRETPADGSAPADVSRETLRLELGQALADAVIEQVEIATKYAGYIGKQAEEVQRAAHFEHLRLPAELDYAQVPALSHEVRQRLGKHRPETLGQASRLQGITPAAISLLLVHLKKRKFKGLAPIEDAESGSAADTEGAAPAPDGSAPAKAA